MKTRLSITTLLAVVSPISFGITIVHVDVSKDALALISIADDVETSIGTLEFFDIKTVRSLRTLD